MSETRDRDRSDWLILALLAGGVISLIVLAAPGLVFVGFALLVLPGIVLWLTPPVFMYAAPGVLIWRGLFGAPKLRWAVTPLVLAAVAVAPPWYFNARLDREVAQLKRDDLATRKPPPPADTVAVFFDRIPGADLDATVDCSEICRRLLYNGFARRVIVGKALTSLDGEPPRGPLAAFRLERRDACPPPPAMLLADWWEHWAEKGLADLTLKRVKARIAQGDCLIAETASADDAQLLYIEREAQPAKQLSNWSLSADVWRVHRTELWARDGAKLTALYRFTAADTIRIATPFAVGVTGLYFPVGAGSGIFRQYLFEDGRRIGDVAPALFGPAAAMPAPLAPPETGAVRVCGFGEPGCRALDGR